MKPESASSCRRRPCLCAADLHPGLSRHRFGGCRFPREGEAVSEHKRSGRPPYPAEVRDRAVRMVLDHQDEYPSHWMAIESIYSARFRAH